MVRGAGKYKTKRGGGRQFSKNMVLDENGTAVSTDKRWNKDKDADGSGSDIEEEDEEEEEESGEEQDSNQPELSRAERKELKRKQAADKKKQANGDDEEEDSDLVNPNHVKTKMNISDLGAPRELSRKEREAKEKKEAQDKYWKLHVAGKTDQAKADLSRLAKIRAEREAAAEKRKAEVEAKKAELEEKQKASSNKR